MRKRVDELRRGLERFLFELDLGNGLFVFNLASDEFRRGRVWRRVGFFGRLFCLSSLLHWVYKKAFKRKTRAIRGKIRIERDALTREIERRVGEAFSKVREVDGRLTATLILANMSILRNIFWICDVRFSDTNGKICCGRVERKRRLGENNDWARCENE